MSSWTQVKLQQVIDSSRNSKDCRLARRSCGFSEPNEDDAKLSVQTEHKLRGTKTEAVRDKWAWERPGLIRGQGPRETGSGQGLEGAQKRMDGGLYIGKHGFHYVSDVRQLDFAFHPCRLVTPLLQGP